MTLYLEYGIRWPLNGGEEHDAVAVGEEFAGLGPDSIDLESGVSKSEGGIGSVPHFYIRSEVRRRLMAIGFRIRGRGSFW